MNALLFCMLADLDGLRATEVLLFVNLYAAVGADKPWVLVKLVDFCAGFGRFHLAHMQFTMFFGVQAIIFGHKRSSLSLT